MKDIEDIAKEKYPDTIFPKENDIEISPLWVLVNLRHAFICGSQYGKEWISVKDRPLVKNIKGGWQTTSDGIDDFIAAVPYNDKNKPGQELWWIRHCRIVDETGMCVVTDVDEEPAGWEIFDVTHWMPLPEPPKPKP